MNRIKFILGGLIDNDSFKILALTILSIAMGFLPYDVTPHAPWLAQFALKTFIGTLSILILIMFYYLCIGILSLIRDTFYNVKRQNEIYNEQLELLERNKQQTLLLSQSKKDTLE